MIGIHSLLGAATAHGNGYCEWEVWGRTNNDIYVWAICKAKGPIGTAGSVTAVVQLGQNDEIDKVIIPRDGIDYSNDIRELFPADIHKSINSSASTGPEAKKHIQEKMTSYCPPLYVSSGIPSPELSSGALKAKASDTPD